MAPSLEKRSRFLSEELVEEILVRLPVKSIVRFKSVCKSWRSRFDSRLFIQLHRLRLLRCDYSSTPLVHSTRTDNLVKMAPELAHLEPSDLRLSSNNREGWARVIRVFGPLNNGGIYGLTSHLQETSVRRRSSVLTGKICFCNPATHDYMLANPIPCQFHSLLSGIASKPCLIHFGFGSCLMDYKAVVLINYGEPFSSFLGFVYSLRSGEWKKLVDYERRKRDIGGGDVRAFNIRVPLVPCPQVFFEGCWHWMALTGPDRPFSVLSFHFADEAFKWIGGAPCHMEEYHTTDEQQPPMGMKGEVLVLHNHLAVVHIFETMLPRPQCVEVDVWMMMEYGVEESWTRIYSIQPNFCGVFSRLVGIYSSGDEEESGSIRIEKLSFEQGSKQRTICCTRSGGYEAFSVCKPNSIVYWNTPGISTYKETLEPLKNVF